MTTLAPPLHSHDLSLLRKKRCSNEAEADDDSSSTLDTMTDLQQELDLQDASTSISAGASAASISASTSTDVDTNVHVHFLHDADNCNDYNHASTTPSSPKFKKVRFETVQIREYRITLGDNPSCSSGPPLQLDWMYYDTPQEIPLELYEKCRHGNRRCMYNMKIPSEVRYYMMKEWEVSRNEIVKVQLECEAIKKQRSKVIRRYQLEESLKYFGNHLKKKISCRDSSSVVQ